MPKINTKTLVYCSICIALATALSMVKLFQMPMGGEVTACSMLFISLTGYLFGPAVGIVSGAAYGLLQIALDGYIVHPIQLVLDYPLAFGILGVSGFFANMKGGLVKGYLVGAVGRFICSFLSGVVFFASYAGDQNVYVYSASYNISYILPEIIITVALVSIPAFSTAINRVRRNAQ